MDPEVIGLFDRKIAEAEQALAGLKDARAVYLKREVQRAGQTSTRFYRWAPIDAIRLTLEEKEVAMSQAELHQILVDGGITIDRARGEGNIRLSFKESLKLGRLVEKNKVIGLPEWEDDKF